MADLHCLVGKLNIETNNKQHIHRKLNFAKPHNDHRKTKL